MVTQTTWSIAPVLGRGRLQSNQIVEYTPGYFVVRGGHEIEDGLFGWGVVLGWQRHLMLLLQLFTGYLKM